MIVSPERIIFGNINFMLGFLVSLHSGLVLKHDIRHFFEVKNKFTQIKYTQKRKILKIYNHSSRKIYTVKYAHNKEKT